MWNTRLDMKYIGKAIRAYGKQYDVKGRYGEMIVVSIFDDKFFGNDEHYIVNDLYFGDGSKTTQIDHVVIYKTGIFCIETKNIDGAIIGDETSRYWMQYKNGQSRRFYNPIMQNINHSVCLSKFFNNQYNIHSVVVFIKSNKPKTPPIGVVNLEELKDYVKNFKSEILLSSNEMKEICNLLLEHKKNNTITRQQHIRNNGDSSL